MSFVYKRLNNKVNRMAKSLRALYHEREIGNLQKDDKDWWKKIKQMTDIDTQNNSIFTLANNITGGDLHDLAELANESFVSVSEGLKRLQPLGQNLNMDIPDKYMYIISVEDVQRRLQQVDRRKAVGPDYLPNWLLKDFSHILVPPIYHASLAQSAVPTVWRSADVIPLSKVNPPTLVEKDLRPIALTPVLAKVLEGFICKWLEDLSPDTDDMLQFGCVKGTSMTHCLIDLHHNWCMATNTPTHQSSMLGYYWLTSVRPSIILSMRYYSQNGMMARFHLSS